MIDRRKFLIAGAVVSVAGCGATGTGIATVTIQDIITWLQTNCKFTTTVDAIAQVISTVIAGFNAAAGAAAVVVVSVATQVEQMICNAVQQQVAQNASLSAKLGGAANMVVVVNGVNVPGTYGG